MPDQSVTDTASRISELTREALRLADEAQLFRVGIYLDQALQALDAPSSSSGH